MLYYAVVNIIKIVALGEKDYPLIFNDKKESKKPEKKKQGINKEHDVF